MTAATEQARVDAAYRHCAAVTHAQARNFAYGIALLPGPKRRALSAVYALARRIDDVGDGDLPADRKAAELARIRAAVARPGDHPNDPVLVAVADAARRYPIPLPAFGELVDGCEMDLAGTRYETLADLTRYCRNVAGSVGRLSLGVFDPRGTPAELAEWSRLADTLGVALQLTNILRDVREDLLAGRTYLPAQDLARFGCELRLGPGGVLDRQDGRLAELVRFEATRAAERYADGLALLAVLDRRSAACCGALAAIYRELLGRIAAAPDEIRHGRVSLPGRRKAAVAARCLTAALAGRPRRRPGRATAAAGPDPSASPAVRDAS